MVQGREKLRLTLESRAALPVPRQLLRQDFDRHIAAELGVPRFVDLTRYTQIVFESQRNTNFVFNRSKKCSAPVEKWKRRTMAHLEGGRACS